MTFKEWWIEYRGYDDPYSGCAKEAWNAAILAALEIALRHETVEPECDDTINKLRDLKVNP